VIESRSAAQRGSGRDHGWLPARGSDLAVVVQHLFTPARSVLGTGGEGDEDGPLCGRPGGAVPMEATGNIYAEAEAVPGAAAGDCQ